MLAVRVRHCNMPCPVVDFVSTNGLRGDHVAELTGNKAIEDAAIKGVVELERAAGRLAEDTRRGCAWGSLARPTPTLH